MVDVGVRRSLEHQPRQAPWFYAVVTLSLVAAGVVVATGIDLVALSVAVEVTNAALLPIVLGFLFLLARCALPSRHRLRGAYAWVVGATIAGPVGFAVTSAVVGLAGASP